MKIAKRIAKQKVRRRWRVRNGIRRGAKSRPRLSVFRSNKHMYAQLIDDESGQTIAAASSRQSGVCPDGVSGANKQGAQAVGTAIAARAVEHGIKQVVFDRGLYQFHGRVAELAAAARQGGLEF